MNKVTAWIETEFEKATSIIASLSLREHGIVYAEKKEGYFLTEAEYRVLTAEKKSHHETIGVLKGERIIIKKKQP